MSDGDNDKAANGQRKPSVSLYWHWLMSERVVNERLHRMTSNLL